MIDHVTPGLTDLDKHISQLDQLPFDYFWHDHRFKTALALANRYSTHAIKNWLDFGSGSGWFLEFLAKHSSGIAVHGVDSSPEARGNDIKKELSEIRQKYHVISLFDVLEHIQDDRQQLIDLQKYLENNGLVIITVPAFAFLWSRWDEKLGHHRRYTQRSLKHVVESSGFKIVKTSYLFSYLLPLAWKRAKSQFAANKDNLEFPKIAKSINHLLKLVNRIERAILQFTALPVGTSVILIAKKK